MTDLSELPGFGESTNPYFPALEGIPKCFLCEEARDCLCMGKYQRGRRDFTWTSGRCPRLPDYRGNVANHELALYKQTFPLVTAEREGELLSLWLTVPGERQRRKVRQKRLWYGNGDYDLRWYASLGGEQRVLRLEMDDSLKSPAHIRRWMETRNRTRQVFRCEITADCL